MDIREETTPEYISKDILENDFVNTFLFIYRLQYVIGSCRVHTKTASVSPPTLLQKCYTLFITIVTGGSVYAVIPLYFDLQPETSVTILGTFVLSCIYVAYFCSVMNVRFLNRRQNVEFLFKIQRLDTLMRIDKRKDINASLKHTNDASVILILIAYLGIVVKSFLVHEWRAYLFIGIGISYFSFIVELIMCANIVVYFFIRVRFVNYLMECYLQQDENVRKQMRWSGASEKSIRFVAKDTGNCFTTSEIYIYLKNIFSCFAKYQDLYRFQLLLFCLKLVAKCLISFEIVLYTASRNMQDTIQVSVILVLFMIIESLLALLLAFRFGVFFAEVTVTKRLCIAVMSSHQTGPLRDKAKTMWSMIEKTPPRFSVYDMLDMNAGTFVAIFSLITSLIVTLIQLAFL